VDYLLWIVVLVMVAWTFFQLGRAHERRKR
jgi:hypothetical protein